MYLSMYFCIFISYAYNYLSAELSLSDLLHNSTTKKGAILILINQFAYFFNLEVLTHHLSEKHKIFTIALLI